MRPFLCFIDKFYSLKFGKMVLITVCLIAAIVFNKLLKQSGRDNSDILKLAFASYRKRVKFLVTLVGVYLLCVFNLFTAINSEKIIQMIISNAVFLILSIIDEKKSFDRISNIDDVKYLIFLYGWFAFNTSWICISFELLREWLFPPKLGVSLSASLVDPNKMIDFGIYIFGQIMKLPTYFIFAPTAIISLAMLLNYVILFLLIRWKIIRGFLSKSDQVK